MDKHQLQTSEEKVEKKNRYDLIGAIGFLGFFFIRVFLDPAFLDGTVFFRGISRLVPQEWGGATTFCGVLGLALLISSVFNIYNRKK